MAQSLIHLKKEPSLVASNQQIYDLYKRIILKKTWKIIF